MNSGSPVYQAAGSSLGVSLQLTAQGQKASLVNFSPTLKAGDILAVSILQLGAGSNFGVSFDSASNYPYSTFLYQQGSTAYFKCLQSLCSTGKIASLQNDAVYYVHAFSVSGSSGMSSLMGYMQNFQSYMSTIVNHLVNINGSIYNLDQTVQQKINGVYEWFRSTNIGYENRHEELMRAIEQFKNSPSEQLASQELAKQTELESQDNSGALQSQQLANPNAAKDQSLIDSIVQIANTPATNCLIRADVHGMKMNLDYCRDPRPSFVGPLLAMVSAIIGILLSYKLIKEIANEVNKFRKD